MTMTRDFLMADPTPDATIDLPVLITRQTELLAEIASQLRQQNASVLASAVVRGASQLTNQIVDANCHEVWFEVGGKPVTIHSLLAFSTYTTTIGLSVVSMSKVTDGIPIAAGDVLTLPIHTSSIYLMTTGAGAINLAVNGPSDPITGGIYIYGYAIADYYRER